MASVSLLVSEKDADPDRVDHITRQLRRELLELNAGPVELVPAPKPDPHAKAADPVTLGALAIAVLPGVLPKIVEFLQAWVLRGSNRTIKIKTEVNGRVIDLECTGRVPQGEINALLKQALGEG